MMASTLIGELPQGDSTPVVVEQDQDVYDIMDLMTYAHKKNADAYDRISDRFWAGDVYSTCHGLYDFCKDEIRYDIENEDIQTVCSPRRILEKSRGDCKHYASFINGILSSLSRKGYAKINPVYRFASYKLFDDVPTHVFAVVKDSKGEIWIDPVLDEFDTRSKLYTFATDRKVNDAAQVGYVSEAQMMGCVGDILGCASDCDCQTASIGGAKSTGKAISTFAPALAIIPVVGWIGAGVGEVVGLALQMFGHDYQYSAGVRWLIQLYQNYVLGQSGVSGTNANEALFQPACQWFYSVLGVPITDRVQFDKLKGYKYATDVDLKKSIAQRIQDYMSDPIAQANNVSEADAAQAVAIASTMNYHVQPGGWKDFPFAPNVLAMVNEKNQVDAQGQPVSSQVMQSGQPVLSSASFESYLPFILIGGAIFLILKK